MGTEVLRVLDRSALAEEFERVGAILRAGGLVAFPTETVYGVAASAENPDAVERLYRVKDRPRSKPMTMMVANCDPVRERCPRVPKAAIALMKRFWPGPLTVVIPDANGNLAGFRLPAHPLARGLVQAAGIPLYVPSANIAGHPAPTRAEDVLRDFPEALDLVIDGGPAEHGVASTVVQIVGDEVTVLREGAIPEWRLRSPQWANILFVCRGNTDRSPLAAAILERKLALHIGCEERQLPQKGFLVTSAGVAAEEVFDPPIDLSRHRSRKLTQALVEKASRIFCMERELRDQILAFFPHRTSDVFLLDPEGGDIDDPAGSPYQDYLKLASRLDAAAQLIVGSLVS